MNTRLPNFDSEERPWGNFARYTLNEESTVKILTVRPHEQNSLQTHARRREHWVVLDGSCTVTIGGQELTGKPGDEFSVPQGAPHRIHAGAEGVRVLELSFGHFDEADITRLEDKYGRAS